MKKWVLITGASTGIGRTCALDLARRGFHVLAGVRKDADGQELARAATGGAAAATSAGAPASAASPASAGAATSAVTEANAATTIIGSNPARQSDNGSLTPLKIDVTDAASISAAAERADSLVGDTGLFGLVNNAGVVVPGPVEFVPIDEWRRQFEINFFGQIAVTQAMLPLLRKSIDATAKPARLVFMGSIGGRVSQPMMSAYTCSKFALESLADALRLELAGQKIFVSLIEPGAISTPIWKKGEDWYATVPPNSPARARYGKMIDAFVAAVRKAANDAVAPEKVAAAVADCLTRAVPRTRYVVGRDAQMARGIKWLLPDRWWDAMLSRAMKLPRD